MTNNVVKQNGVMYHLPPMPDYPQEDKAIPSKRERLHDAIHRDLWIHAFGGRNQIYLMLSPRGALVSFKIPQREQVIEFTRFFEYDKNGEPADGIEVTIPSVDVEHNETGLYPKAFAQWRAPLPTLT